MTAIRHGGGGHVLARVCTCCPACGVRASSAWTTTEQLLQHDHTSSTTQPRGATTAASPPQTAGSRWTQLSLDLHRDRASQRRSRQALGLGGGGEAAAVKHREVAQAYGR
jgi:hypothetical protein